MLCHYNSKMLNPDKSYVLYSPDGHGTFPVSKFSTGVPRCPVCDKVLRKMEGVVQK